MGFTYAKKKKIEKKYQIGAKKNDSALRFPVT